MQRFKPALTCGSFNPENPEDLVRDENGEYIKYEDHKEVVRLLEEEIEDLRKSI
jgi:hypothetical protein